MSNPIFFLALNIAIADCVTMITNDRSVLLTYHANLEEWNHIIASNLFDGDISHVISCVRIGSELKQKYCDIFGASYSCKMKWSVSIFICNFDVGTVLQQKLNYIGFLVVFSSF